MECFGGCKILIFPKFLVNLPKLYPNLPKFCPNLPKKFARGWAASPDPTALLSSVANLQVERKSGLV